MDRDRRLILQLGAAAFVALLALRVASRAPDAWEWDEILFGEAVRAGLDLRINHPHPPGYPLFVESARLLARFGVPPFEAATLTATLGSALAPVGLYGLLVSLGVSPGFALLGGALYAFVPAVWLHGVRPLSDGPGTAFFLAAAAALVGSLRHSRPALLVAGAAAGSLCAGLRPQAAIALLPLACVAALAAFRQSGGSRSLVLAGGVALVLSLVIWAPLVSGSGGWRSFWTRISEQAAYARQADFLSLSDLGRWAVWERWLRDPFGPTALAICFGALSVAGIVAAPRSATLLLLAFLPLAAVTIPTSTLEAAPRYSVALLPLPASLAALALERLGTLTGRRMLAALAGGALAAASAAVAAPAVREVATRPSPPVAAMRALASEPGLASRPLLVWNGLMLHEQFFLARRRTRYMKEDELVPVSSGDLIVMADDAIFGQAPLRRFAFSDPALLRISRARYLSVSITEADPRVGLVRLDLEGAGTHDSRTSEVRMERGDTFIARGLVGPIEVRVVCTAPFGGSLDLHGGSVSRSLQLPAGTATPLVFDTSPEADSTLFRIRCVKGPAVLTGWRLSPGREGK